MTSSGTTCARHHLAGDDELLARSTVRDLSEVSTQTTYHVPYNPTSKSAKIASFSYLDGKTTCNNCYAYMNAGQSYHDHQWLLIEYVNAVATTGFELKAISGTGTGLYGGNPSSEAHERNPMST